MADEQLTFLGWVRPPGHELASGQSVTPGRLAASVSLTLSDVDDPADARTRQVAYDLIGPADVTGLRPGAVVRTHPSPGALAVEADKAVYAELAAADLPWRYTLDRPQEKALKPWIVVVVGTTTEIEVQGDKVRIQPSALDAHPLAGSARLAHVEVDPSGHSVARLISPRPLQAGRAHVAVIVPTFDAAGQPAWPTPATGPVEVPAYYSWTFETKTGGDFAVLARRLHLVQPEGELGTSSVHYGPVPSSAPMSVGGALTAATPPPDSVPTELATDLKRLTGPTGTANRPIVGLPDLAAAWPPDETEPVAVGWRDGSTEDFRVRAVAGLGERAGVVHADLLAEQAARIAGAYEEAADRLRRLATGLLVSRSLWRRRVPTGTMARLAFVGPALRNLATPTTSVPRALEHPQRALEQSLFSSAAARTLRPRPSDVSFSPISADVGAALPEAAAAPGAPTRSGPGTLHTDAFARAVGRPALDDVVTKTLPDLTRVRAAASTLARRLDMKGLDRDTGAFVKARLDRALNSRESRADLPLLPLLGLLDDDQPLTRSRARFLASAIDAPPDSSDLAALAGMVSEQPVTAVVTAYDLAAASDAIMVEFDPTGPRSSLVDRGLAGIRDAGSILETLPAGPVEMAPDLQLAAWGFLRDDEPEWLLPGATGLLANTVVGLTTNPAFVDAFLLGLNAQVVAELRFRNHPLIPGWTPVRTFWDRVNLSTRQTDDDIAPIDQWPRATAFGDQEHQTPSASSADLVVLFTSALFREYPGTIVSLVPAGRTASGGIDWTLDPVFASRLLPTFQGRVSPDQTFFGFDLDPVLGKEYWVMLEETVNGRRFLARATTATNGADLATDLLRPPRRVLIRGDILLAGMAP
jgi:hypothetical protein